MDTDRVMSGKELQEATGMCHTTLCMIRKAGMILGDPIPNYASPSDFHAWRRRWPQFIAKDWEGLRWVERLARYNAEDRRAQLVSKFGGRKPTNAQQTP